MCELVCFAAGTIYLNDVPILLEETPVSHGTLYFVDNLFFVTPEIVRSLNEANRDKESGPLLGSPWPDSQYLSHVLLASEERDDAALFSSYLNSSSVSQLFPTRKGLFFGLFSDPALFALPQFLLLIRSFHLKSQNFLLTSVSAPGNPSVNRLL